jgi:hypothetical protein
MQVGQQATRGQCAEQQESGVTWQAGDSYMAVDVSSFADGNVKVMLGQRHRDLDHPLIGCFVFAVVSSDTLSGVRK